MSRPTVTVRIRVCEHTPLAFDKDGTPTHAPQAPCYACATMTRNIQRQPIAGTFGIFDNASRPIVIGTACEATHRMMDRLNGWDTFRFTRRFRLASPLTISPAA